MKKKSLDHLTVEQLKSQRTMYFITCIVGVLLLIVFIQIGPSSSDSLTGAVFGGLTALAVVSFFSILKLNKEISNRNDTTEEVKQDVQENLETETEETQQDIDTDSEDISF